MDGPYHVATKEQEHVVKAAAGITFSLFLTKSGRRAYPTSYGREGLLVNVCLNLNKYILLGAEKRGS